ncbi:MAG: YjfB family protein [Lachnospiraceae bacterium]|nr:YjfB family protein [Lachnospiraceae bacterium]
MDAASGLAQASVMNDVGVAMLKNTMEQNEIQGAGITRMMMEQSVNPAVGGNFDMSV